MSSTYKKWNNQSSEQRKAELESYHNNKAKRFNELREIAKKNFTNKTGSTIFTTKYFEDFSPFFVCYDNANKIFLEVISTKGSYQLRFYEYASKVTFDDLEKIEEGEHTSILLEKVVLTGI